MSVEERLLEAIESGEVLRVIYHGGSQPGSVREIAPINIKNGKLSARCFTSNAVKSFMLDKIVIVENEAQPPTAEWQPGLTIPDQYGTISELFGKQRNFLAQLGWHIEHDSDRLSLHRKFKTGKPLKSSDVSLDYEEYAYDLVVDSDGEMHRENQRKRQRPWTVRSKDQVTKTYSHLDKAAEFFMEWAELLAPLPNGNRV
jgi:hypothetical protein